MDIYGGSNISPFISRIFFPLSFNALLTVMEFLGIDITRGWFNTTVSNTEEARTRHLKILTLAFSLVFSQLLCHAMPFHSIQYAWTKKCASITQMLALNSPNSVRVLQRDNLFCALQIFLNYENAPIFWHFGWRAIIIISLPILFAL